MAAGRHSVSAVLVVEDHHDSAGYFATALEHLGLCVLRAAKVRDAEDYIEHFDLEAVVTDLAMPDGSGFTVLKAVKQHQPRVPVIAVTAHFVDRVVSPSKQGFAATLYKPVEPDQLVRVVLGAIDEAGRRTSIRRDARRRKPLRATANVSPILRKLGTASTRGSSIGRNRRKKPLSQSTSEPLV